MNQALSVSTSGSAVHGQFARNGTAAASARRVELLEGGFREWRLA